MKSARAEERWSWLWPLAPALLSALAMAAWIGRVGPSPLDYVAALGAGDMLAGRAFPLTYNFKNGPGPFYLTAPFLLVFGHTLRALRVSAVFWAAAAVAATGLLAQRCTGDRKAGLLAACLAAATPGFILLGAEGHYGGCAETALACLALAEIIACARDRRPARARLAGLLLGAAIMTKSAVGAFVPGLIVLALARRPRLDQAARRLVLQGAGVLILPLIPFIWSLTAGGLWRRWLPSLIVREDDGRSNLDIAGNLIVRLRQMRAFTDMNVILRTPHPWLSGAAAVFAAAFLAAALLAFARAKKQETRAAAFLWSLAPIYFFMTAFTPSMLRWTHLLPLVAVLLAAAAASLAAIRPGWGRRAAAVLVTGYLAAGGASVAIQAMSLARDGGATSLVDARNANAGLWFLARPSAAPAVAEGSPIGWPIEYLAGRKTLRLPTEGPFNPDDIARWDPFFADPSAVFAVDPDDRESLRTLDRQAADRGFLLEKLDAGSGAPSYDYIAARKTR